MQDTLQYKNLTITKYLKSGFRIDWEGDHSFPLSEMVNGQYAQTIYIDPYKLPQNQPKGDVVFISHVHADHFDVESLTQITHPNTVIITNKTVAEQLRDSNLAESVQEIRAVDWQEQQGLSGLTFLALPAYNLDKRNDSGRMYHAAEEGGIAFLLEFNAGTQESARLLHMGDTDYLPEFHQPNDIDILMVPIAGKYVMTNDEAIRAAREINAKYSIPMHYDGGSNGSIEDAEYFVKKLGGSAVVLKSNSAA